MEAPQPRDDKASQVFREKHLGQSIKKTYKTENMENRVVITGMGIWSCIGQTLDEVRQSLYDGKSGIIFSQERKDMG